MKFSRERMSAQKSWMLVFEGRAQFSRAIPPTLQTLSLTPELEHSVTFAGSVSPAL